MAHRRTLPALVSSCLAETPRLAAAWISMARAASLARRMGSQASRTDAAEPPVSCIVLKNRSRIRPLPSQSRPSIHDRAAAPSNAFLQQLVIDVVLEVGGCTALTWSHATSSWSATSFRQRGVHALPHLGARHRHGDLSIFADLAQRR
jgi:hypothetical protein